MGREERLKASEWTRHETRKEERQEGKAARREAWQKGAEGEGSRV